MSVKGALLVAALAFMQLACGRHQANKPDAEPTSNAETAKYNDVVSTIPQFLDDGWIVSRGSNTNEGDSLFFSGLAMYSLPCDAAAPIADAMEKQLKTGALVRFPGNKDAVSFDGYVGFYRGVAARVVKCGEKQRWHDALANAHLDTLPVGFDFLRKGVLHLVGLGDAGSATEQARMEGDAASFAAGSVLGHKACFRPHLSLLSMQAVEQWGGKISDEGRLAFCEAMRGARIETAEHFCGRSDLSSYIGGFQRDVWIFEHQRCPGWETPDAKADHEPGLDLTQAVEDKRLGL